MPDWIGLGTKIFGPIGQRLLNKWLFDAEFLGARRVLYLHDNGDSPSVAIFISVLVHNRNSAPTTIYPRGLSVTLKDRTDRSFARMTVTPGGFIRSVDNFGESDRYDMGGSSSIELLLYTTRYNPPQIAEYFNVLPLPITLILGETFGNRRTLKGLLEFESVKKQ